MIDEAKDLLLWLDLETTGGDETKDSIIEIGCILTTQKLEPIAPFESLVTPEAEGLGRLMMDPVVRPMHENNGLLAEILKLGSGGDLRPHNVAQECLNWMTQNGATPGHVVLAGSGVGHFDRRFIRRWMPRLDRYLRHWVVDVGVIRRAHRMWVDPAYVSKQNEAKTHRALDDAQCHLEEAREFAALWSCRLGVPR